MLLTQAAELGFLLAGVGVSSGAAIGLREEEVRFGGAGREFHRVFKGRNGLAGLVRAEQGGSACRLSELLRYHT